MGDESQWPPEALATPGDKAKYALQAQIFCLGGTCPPTTSPPQAPEKYYRHRYCYHGSRNPKLKRLPTVSFGRTSCQRCVVLTDAPHSCADDPPCCCTVPSCPFAVSHCAVAP